VYLDTRNVSVITVIMADLLDSILGSMEKPPVLDADKKKARGQFNSTLLY